MPFGTIVSGSVNYAPREPGNYTDSTLSFASPTRELNVTGFTPNKDKTISGSVSHVLEKDVTFDGVTTRHVCRCVLSGQLTKSFTTAEVVASVKAIYDFVDTAGFADRLLQGES
jgi:hypothetical protein